MKSNILPVYMAIFFCFGAFAPASIGAEEGQGAKVLAITLPQTGQAKSYALTDDANLHKGASWPKPRFKVNDDETVTDNLTGLVWTKTARNPGPPECVSGRTRTGMAP